MIEPEFLKFDTLSLHTGRQPDPSTGARAVPIYMTTSYVFDDSDHAAGLFNLEIPGHLYSRLTNPTVAVLEERIAALEGGVGAVCTASGQAAFHLAMVTRGYSAATTRLRAATPAQWLQATEAAFLNDHARNKPRCRSRSHHCEIGCALHIRPFVCGERAGQQGTAGDHGKRPTQTDQEQSDEHAEAVGGVGV